MNGFPAVLPFLAMQVASPEPAATFPADVEATLGAGPMVQSGAARGTGVAGELGLNWYYRRPIVADASPFGLQSYLQRLNTISLGLGAEGFNAKSDLEDDHSRTLSARLGWLGYWRRYLFAGEVYYAHFDERQRSADNGTMDEMRRLAQTVRPSLSFGIREQTFELRASYLWPAYVEGYTFSVPTWRIFALSARLVPESSQSLSLLLYTVPNNGAGASATYEYFHGQRLSFWARGEYQSGQFYPPIQCDDTARYGGAAGLRHWLSNRFEWRFSINATALRAVCPRAEDVQDVGPAYGRGDTLIEILANVGIAVRIAGRPQSPPPSPPPPPPPPPPTPAPDQLRTIEIQ